MGDGRGWGGISKTEKAKGRNGRERRETERAENDRKRGGDISSIPCYIRAE